MQAESWSLPSGDDASDNGMLWGDSVSALRPIRNDLSGCVELYCRITGAQESRARLPTVSGKLIQSSASSPMSELAGVEVDCPVERPSVRTELA
jgi:hypothetical protein